MWRDIKVIGNHAFILAYGARAHGMQVFDLTRLRAAPDTPAVFTLNLTPIASVTTNGAKRLQRSQ